MNITFNFSCTEDDADIPVNVKNINIHYIDYLNKFLNYINNQFSGFLPYKTSYPKFCASYIYCKSLNFNP